jgi:hypothetical protein
MLERKVHKIAMKFNVKQTPRYMLGRRVTGHYVG